MRKKIVTVLMVLSLMTAFAANGFAKEMDSYTNTDYDQYLMKHLNDKNLGIRTSAAQLLGERKTVQAIDQIAKMLKHDKDYRARIIAAVVIMKIGDMTKLELLRQRARKDKNETVRHVLAGVIREMEKQVLAEK